MNDSAGIGPHEKADESQASFGFGKGGIPWYLMLFYISFMVFFVWYVLEYQLPEYLEHGPITPATGELEAR